MSTTLVMPRLGETMEEGRIVAWLVKPGERFQRGDPILEVETDKTVVEFPALGDGILIETLAAEADTVAVGAPIASVDIGDGPDWTREGDAAPEPQPAEPPASPRRVRAPTADQRARATPLARRIARQNGVDVAQVEGTGRRGRVERADVEAHQSGAVTQGGDVAFLEGIAHVAEGPEAGESFLLVHGFAGDHTTFATLSSGLARAGRRAIAVDLPAHGATALEATSLADLAPPLIAFADKMFRARQPHIVASSMGAVPAVAVAEALQPASLTLLAPVGLGLFIDGAFLDGMAAADSTGEVLHLLSHVTEGPLPITESRIGDVADRLANRRLTGLAGALHNEGRQRVSLVAPLARLAERFPVRIIVGHRDRILDSRDAFNVSPRIAVHHLPQVGHMPAWEAPTETLAVLLAGI